MAVTALALGVLYAGLFGNERVDVQLPYVLVGFIVWGFIRGCITEGSEVFIANEGLIKHLPAPMTVHVLPAGLAPAALLRCTTSSSTWSCWRSSSRPQPQYTIRTAARRIRV